MFFKKSIKKKDIKSPILMYDTRFSYTEVGNVLYDFEAKYSNEMSVKKDENVYIVNDDEPGWTRVRRIRTKEEGYIPRSYIKFLRPMDTPQKKRVGIVLYDFKAESPEELSVRKDQKVIILDESNKHWTLVKVVSSKYNISGYIPRTYVV